MNTEYSSRVKGIAVKRPAVAGLFYPAEPDQLRRDVDAFLTEAPPRAGLMPRAMIVPHAGYVYSGSIAGSAYRQLSLLDHPVERVVMLGPAHRVPVLGIAVHGADYFRTPLGDVPLDRALLDGLLNLPFVHSMDPAFTQEHCLEVQLPFLQEVLGDFSLAPMLVGQCGYREVDQVLERIGAGPETLILISSDLSHYHPYEEARRMDAGASRAIEALEPEALQYDHACGRIPIGGLLLFARRHRLRAVTLDQRNSGDTAGPRNQVVGYGAYVFV
ncbi:MAG: AmmeMemoRadiSam system protein B [Gammaproteobacteria bacterium]|nr:AmmeMemoRadiSam system protein B [Gammaproteobacteria bacterium]MBU1655966.1 AmmeMemoRadiSam system protein B [Gammaproteobacteria bacterium]MBU1962541.1 AmmeMemoRadiSam system protein B [Gammaproteobacteria bacterium]